MKRLLLLFILSPVILFGQMRRGDIVDSINANATDLQNVSKLINNSRGTGVENIKASDSGEYVTIVVRVRVVEPVVIPVLPPLPVVKIEPGAVVTGIMSMVNTPPLPPLIYGEPVGLLAITLFRIEDMAVGKANTVIVPALRPHIIEGARIEAVPSLAVAVFGIKDFVVNKLDTAAIPPLPDIQTFDPLPLLAAIKFTIVDPPAARMDTVAVPDIEEKKMPVEGMHLSAAGYSLLEKLEGFSPNLYALKDGGLTIGFGFFVPYHEGRLWNKGVTWEEAERIMREKVPQYEDQVKQYINVPLTQTEFDALTMMAYNLGGFSKATSIVNDINSGADFDKLQKDWMRFVHSKAPGVMKGLMNRRRDELKVRNASDYQPERKIQILKNIK